MTTVDTDLDGITIPDSPAALEEALTDSKFMKNLYLSLGKDGGDTFGRFVQAYASHVLKRDTDIANQVRAETEKQLKAFLADQADQGLVPAGPVNYAPNRDESRRARLDARAGLHHDRALGAGLNDLFGDGPYAMAECLQAIWRNYKRSASSAEAAKLRKMQAAFDGDVPSDGGFLIPENLRSEILRVSLEASVVRPRARIIPMETLTVPFPALDDTSHVSSTHGGITTSWAEAGSNLAGAESSPKFRRLVLHARKLIAYTKVEQELIADSIVSFLPFINELFPEAIGFAEDSAFMTGDGVGQPLGALNTTNGAMVAVTAEGTQPAGTIVWENIVKMYARMLPGSLNRAVWVATPDSFPELATMALSVGTGGSAVWLNNGAEGPPATILGRPVIISEKTPGLLGSQGDLSFVDFGYYLVGDRMAMQASVSEHADFETDQVAYKITERVDGRPWLNSPITPKNAGPTLSPYVQLAARA